MLRGSAAIRSCYWSLASNYASVSLFYVIMLF